MQRMRFFLFGLFVLIGISSANGMVLPVHELRIWSIANAASQVHINIENGPRKTMILRIEPEEVLHRRMAARRYLLSGRLQWGDPARKEIALTFDDGPHPPFTPRLLELLRRLKVHATFFVVGRKVDQAPELLQQIVRDGHEIANHTYHHFNLKQVPAELVESEMRLDNDAIRRACGRTPRFFRPSGGQFNADVVQAVRRRNMTMALWTDDPGDYDPDLGSAVIETRLLRHVRPGAILLLHDGMEQTYAMLTDFVARMRREGYRFITLSEMAQHLQTNDHQAVSI